MKQQDRSSATPWLVWFALCMLLLPLGASATQLPLTAYGQDHGLSSLSVIRLHQDRQGFVWVGTEKGLYRFEGVGFNQVGTEQGFTVSEVVSLAEDAQGRLWVGSRAGLQLREHEHFEWVQPGGKLLHVDRGQTLAPTADGGMLLVSGNRLQQLVPDARGQWQLQSPFSDSQLKEMPGLRKISAVFHRDGISWFGCGEEMCRLRDGQLERYGPARGVPADRWLGILSASDGSLWVRGMRTVRRLAVGADAFVGHDLPGNQTEVAASSIDLVEDDHGHVLTRSASGLARWDGSRWELFGTDEGIPTVGVSSLLADRDGTIWIGTYGRGLLHWSGGDATQNWTAAQGLGTLIWSVARDRSGAVWVADDWGINTIDPSQQRAQRQTLALAPPYQARAVLVADDGAVWFFLFDGRVLRRPSASSAIAVVATLPFLVRGAYLDRAGRFWAYTLGGLYSVDAASGRVERAAPGVIPSSMCADLAEDGAGRLWLACSSGLFRHAGGRWARVRVLPQESLGGFENVAVTPDGRLWLSSLQPGLLVGQVGQIGDADSISLAPVDDALLADSRFYFLRTDHQGRLWAGGNSGVDVLDDQHWTRLSSHDGLLWDETNHGAFHADVDGSIWIGSPVGLSHLLRPRQLLAPRDIRPLLLSARYAGQDLAGQDPSVPFDATGALVLRLAVLGNSSGSPVHFRYRLSGIDKDWVETTSRELRYASLPHGDYRFELQTIDVNQRRHSAPLSLSFALQPPWWRSWSAYAGLALLALAALALAWRWRVRVLVMHARRLEQAVTLRTGQLRRALRERSMLLARISHDLRSPLAGIIDSVRQWRAGDQVRDYPRLIEHSARLQLDLIDELLEFSRDELIHLELLETPGHLHAFLHDVGEQAALLAERHGNRLDCQFAASLPALVQLDFRRLRQVLMNLLGNAAKFTHDGHILFAVSSVPAAPGKAGLHVIVEDNGIGIAPAEHERLAQPFTRGDNAENHDGSGLGLAIVTQLLEHMGSRLQIEAVRGGGSRFGFDLNVGLATEDDLEPELHDGDVAASDVDGGGRRVLVVDDQSQSRDLLCDLLDGFGFESIRAADGRAALEALRQQPVNLILTDQSMPDVDGWGLLQAVRQTHPELPVLLYSSLPPRRPPDVADSLAFSDALLKPASARQLLDHIGRLLQQVERMDA